MKNFFRIFLGLLVFIIILGTIFYMVDTAKVHNESEPVFTFVHKIVDGLDYSAKVDIGLGYKIIRIETLDNQKTIKVGTIFMKEEMPNNIVESGDKALTSGDISVSSGESESPKQTTFGESYEDFIMLEGMEEKVYVKKINSKLGYSMNYFYDLFEYVGFEDHDLYKWSLTSGDMEAIMTVSDVTEQKTYDEAIKKIGKDKELEELSGDGMNESFSKTYFKMYTKNEIPRVEYIYFLELDGLRLMVDLSYIAEAAEGIGVYMSNMLTSITKI